MARNRVKVSYQKVERPQARRGRPRASQAVPEPPIKPSISFAPRPLSRLAAYIAENESSGIPVWELVEQFQEYDCNHEDRPIVLSKGEWVWTLCQECGLVEQFRRSAARG